MAVKLHTDPLSYFSFGQSCNEIFSRDATKALLELLAERGFQAVGVDGGIHRDGTFTPRLDWAWTRQLTSRSIAEADVVNKGGIEAIDDDPPECNAYAITVSRFS
jgi:riboflavin biosynthesis pyrimidine reductase